MEAVATGGLRALVAMAKDCSADSSISACTTASLMCGSITQNTLYFISINTFNLLLYSI